MFTAYQLLTNPGPAADGCGFLDLSGAFSLPSTCARNCCHIVARLYFM
jgi:hypothetical protein